MFLVSAVGRMVTLLSSAGRGGEEHFACEPEAAMSEPPWAREAPAPYPLWIANLPGSFLVARGGCRDSIAYSLVPRASAAKWLSFRSGSGKPTKESEARELSGKESLRGFVWYLQAKGVPEPVPDSFPESSRASLSLFGLPEPLLTHCCIRPQSMIH